MARWSGQTLSNTRRTVALLHHANTSSFHGLWVGSRSRPPRPQAERSYIITARTVPKNEKKADCSRNFFSPAPFPPPTSSSTVAFRRFNFQSRASLLPAAFFCSNRLYACTRTHARAPARTRVHMPALAHLTVKAKQSLAADDKCLRLSRYFQIAGSKKKAEKPRPRSAGTGAFYTDLRAQGQRALSKGTVLPCRGASPGRSQA
jgi:hypothetical protein